MLKILFLEDNLHDALLIQKELSRYRLKFAKKVVSKQKDFLKALQDFHPDLILSDYTLPDFTGLAAIDLVQKISPNTPIIIVTGSKSEETAVECMRHGAWDYVLKNHLVQIHQAVQNAMQRQTERAQNIRTQEKLEQLISNLPGIVFRCKSNDNWSMEYISEGCFLLTGYHREELLYDRKLAYADLIFEADKEAVSHNIQQALEKSDTYQIEYRIKHKNGTIIWISERGNAIYDNGNLVTLEGFISDISTRKQAEIALALREKEFKEQSDLLNGVFDNIPDIMGIYDSDYKIQRFNKTGYDFFGKTPKQVIGKNCFEMHNKEFPCQLCPTEKVFATGKSAKVERFLPEKDIWLDARAYPIYNEKGKIVKIIEHLRDITEQKNIEELIISNQKLSSAIIDGSPLGISVRDKNGTLILHNKSWQKIWALTNEEVESYEVKRNNLILNNKDNYLGRHLPAVQDVYENGGSYYVHEVKTSASRLGQAEWISQRFYAITDQDDQVDKVVVLTEDISERKHSQLVHDVKFKISNHVNIKQSLYQLINNIRNEIARLMNTKNFYIAMLDQESGKLIFPYCKDEKDSETRPVWPGKTLSGYVLKTGKPLLVENIHHSFLVKSGVVEEVGFPSKVWMGVPLIYNNATIGLVALQSYDNPKLYDQTDLTTLEFISHEIAAVLEKKRIDDEIAVQKIYFENLFEVSPDALVILSNEDKVMRVNAEFSKLFGYSNKEAENHYINDLIVPTKLKSEAHLLTQDVKIGNSVGKQTVRVSKLGEEIYVEIIGKPIILKSNQLAVLGIYRDIRERVQAENRMKQDLQVNKTLLQELYHRTKNNMQVISSLLFMSSSQTQNQYVKDTFRSINNKIKAMSLVHKKLYQSQDLSKINLAEYLEDLLKLIINSYGVHQKQIDLNFVMDDVYILMDSAIPLGLVINELVSNILKHAFLPEQSKREIFVQLYQKATEEIILILKDNGQGIPDDFRFEESSSLGLKTAINLIQRQLKGEIEYQNDSGLCWQIKIKDEQHQARI